MANWNLPALTSPFVDAVDYFKQRDVDAAQMFDVGSPTNIPENAIRFNVSTGVLQRRESGAWVTRTLSSNALSDVNSNVGTYGSNILIPSFTVNSKGQITGVSTNAVRSASTSTSGVVQLNNTTTSTSTTQAATANAVKVTKDAADAASVKATPKTLTPSTGNTSDGSGHSHSVTETSLSDAQNGSGNAGFITARRSQDHLLAKVANMDVILANQASSTYTFSSFPGNGFYYIGIEDVIDGFHDTGYRHFCLIYLSANDDSEQELSYPRDGNDSPSTRRKLVWDSSAKLLTSTSTTGDDAFIAEVRKIIG